MKLLKQKSLLFLARGVNMLGVAEDFGNLDYRQLYWRLKDYKKASVRGSLRGLLKEGLAAKLVRGERVLFRLTKTGKEQLVSLLPVAGRRGNGRWDLSWRILIYEPGKLTLKQQRQLRQKLFGWGWVMLQKGIYVTPFANDTEVKKMLAKMGLLGVVKVMKTNRLVVGDDREFAKELWQLDTIYKKYADVISLAKRVLYEARRAKSLTDQLKNDYGFVISSWFEVLKIDPGLPKKLLFDDWPYLEAVSLLEETGKVIEELESEGVNV